MKRFIFLLFALTILFVGAFFVGGKYTYKGADGDTHTGLYWVDQKIGKTWFQDAWGTVMGSQKLVQDSLNSQPLDTKDDLE